jgi:hypothetical protein
MRYTLIAGAAALLLVGGSAKADQGAGDFGDTAGAALAPPAAQATMHRFARVLGRMDPVRRTMKPLASGTLLAQVGGTAGEGMTGAGAGASGIGGAGGVGGTGGTGGAAGSGGGF